jgi:hypothetical protein
LPQFREGLLLLLRGPTLEAKVLAAFCSRLRYLLVVSRPIPSIADSVYSVLGSTLPLTHINERLYTTLMDAMVTFETSP